MKWTPLCYAIACRRNQMVKMLLDRPNIDLNLRTGEILTSLSGYKGASFVTLWGGDYKIYRAQLFCSLFSFRTPAEIAEIENNQEAMRMIKKKVKIADKLAKQAQRQAQGKQEVEWQTKLKELAQSLNVHLPSQALLDSPAKEIIHKILTAAEAEPNQNKLEEQMKNGEIPCTGVWQRFSQQVEILKKGSQATDSRVAQLENQLIELEKRSVIEREEKFRVMEELRELKEALSAKKELLQAENTIHFLSKCENELISAFKSKFNSRKFTFEEMEEKEASVFMNLIGQSHHAKSLKEHDTLDGKSLKLIAEQADLAKELKFSLKERLELKFAVGMIEKKEFPPFEDHVGTCNVCRQRATVFAKEYLPELDTAKVEKSRLEAKEIMMMSCEDISKEFGVPLLDSLRLGERMAELRKFHFATDS